MFGMGVTRLKMPFWPLLTASTKGVGEFLSEIFVPIFEFFLNNGEIGLFIYSVIETITPLAGVEVILFPLLLADPARWVFITLNLIIANTIGGIIVYFFLAKEDNKFYNRVVSKKNQENAKKIFDRYGVWAIFIFAMTPLPFFIIIFVAAIARMKLPIYVLAIFFSRGVRFFMTSYAVVFLGGSGDIILWLALIGVGVVVIFVFIQKLILKRLEKSVGIEA